MKTSEPLELTTRGDPMVRRCGYSPMQVWLQGWTENTPAGASLSSGLAADHLLQDVLLALEENARHLPPERQPFADVVLQGETEAWPCGGRIRDVRRAEYPPMDRRGWPKTVQLWPLPPRLQTGSRLTDVVQAYAHLLTSRLQLLEDPIFLLEVEPWGAAIVEHYQTLHLLGRCYGCGVALQRDPQRPAGEEEEERWICRSCLVGNPKRWHQLQTLLVPSE